MFTSLRDYARSTFLPQSAGQTALPRLDLLVMAAAAAGGLLLVAADMFQRWIYYRRIPTLDIDGQYNVETWFHAMILAGAALAALGIAFTHFTNRHRLQWLGAATGVAFLSLDKAISLHERVGIAIVNRFDLPREAGRLLWQGAWSPIILTTAVLLIMCVWRSPLSTKLWILLGLALGGVKLGMEAMIFPLTQLGWVTADRGVAYGIETNIEETAQLLAFAALLAAFAQLFADRLSALARGEELEAATASATPPAAVPARQARSAARPTASTRP